MKLLEGSVPPSLAVRLRALATNAEPMGSRYPDGYRNNDRALLHDEALAAELWPHVQSLMSGPIEHEGEHFEAVGLNPRIRLCRYQDGQQFTRHRDGAWHGEDGIRTVYTVQIYLDQDFDGGHTRFYADRNGPMTRAVRPETGKLIVFDHRLWHDGEAVWKGVKHVLRSDVLVRPRDVASRRGHSGYVWAVAPWGTGVVSVGRDRTLRVWTSPDQSTALAGPGGSMVSVCGVHGRVTVGTRDGRVCQRNQEWQMRAGHEGAVLALLETPNGFASAGADGRVVWWNEALEPVREEAVHDGWIWDLAWVDGAVHSVGEDGMHLRLGPVPSRVWSAPHALTALHGHLIGGADGSVYRAGQRIGRHQARVRAVWDGSIAVSAGEDDCVRMWGPDRTLYRHRDFATGVCESGGRLWSCGYDGTVHALASKAEHEQAVN